MDDLVLTAKIDEKTTLYVSPIDPDTYSQYIEDDSLGGAQGYFVMRSRNDGLKVSFDILAKAATFEAASLLFDLISRSSSRLASA